MPLTIDHAALIVPLSKLDAFVDFILTALAPLGLREFMRPTAQAVGLGDQTPFFWVMGVEGDSQTLETVMKKQHTAFTSPTNELVDKFYEAAIKAGAKDNGAPGPRSHYHPGYYGAFVYDPVCGINLEVVNHNFDSKPE